MKHHSRIDWCALAGIALALTSLLMRASVWITGPVLLILLLCVFPQAYETGENGLVLRDALSRRTIPYDAITKVGLTAAGVHVTHGRGALLVIAPRDRLAFFNDIAGRLPHLVRLGQELVPRDRYVEYSFRRVRGAYRTS